MTRNKQVYYQENNYVSQLVEQQTSKKSSILGVTCHQKLTLYTLSYIVAGTFLITEQPGVDRSEVCELGKTCFNKCILMSNNKKFNRGKGNINVNISACIELTDRAHFFRKKKC